MRRAEPPARAPLALLVLLAAAYALLVVGCSVNTRYQVLDFLFDGVPAPGESPGMSAPAEPSVITDDRSIPPPPAATPTPAPAILSVHEPVRSRNCGACHGLESGNVADVQRDATLCDRCHGEQRQSEGWSHGPINLGTCIPCHVPHESRYPHLLEQPVPELCLMCHQEVNTTADYHTVPNYEDCTACHDPHLMY